MQHSTVTRRGWMAAAAGLAIAGALPSLAQAQIPGNPYARKISYTLQGNFNATEKAIIADSIEIVARRFLEPRMFNWAKPRTKYFAVATPGYNVRTWAEFETWFTGVQRQALLDVGLPRLYLQPVYDPSGTWTGRGTIGTVVTQYRRDARTGRAVPSVAGTFQIKLNTALLGNVNTWQGRDVSLWASTIAHEMLHNLGHDHPQNVYNGTFIRAYEDAIRFNCDPRK